MPFLVFSKLAGPHVGGMATFLAALEGLQVSAVPADMQGELGVFLESLATAVLGALHYCAGREMLRWRGRGAGREGSIYAYTLPSS